MVQLNEEPSKAAYRRWYAKNREEFNRKRREKYKKDKAYREKALNNTRQYRAEGAAHSMDGALYRERDGEMVEVFRISTVAEMIGRSVQAIRQWEKHKIIPKPIFDGGHRVYTAKQIKLMERVVRVSDKHRHNRDKFAKEIAKLRAVISERWEQ